MVSGLCLTGLPEEILVRILKHHFATLEAGVKLFPDNEEILATPMSQNPEDRLAVALVNKMFHRISMPLYLQNVKFVISTPLPDELENWPKPPSFTQHLQRMCVPVKLASLMISERTKSNNIFPKLRDIECFASLYIWSMDSPGEAVSM